MIESTGVTLSMSANNFILKSGRSGPFSGTKVGMASACFESLVKLKRSRDAPGDRPISSSCPQASSRSLAQIGLSVWSGVGRNDV